LWNEHSSKLILASTNGDIVPSQATRPNHTSVQLLVTQDQPGPSFMAKVFTIPVTPNPSRRNKRDRTCDPRYVEGQRLLVEAMKYLAQSNKDANREAIDFLFEHFQTNFRISDSPMNS
jgi:hypothetical protein